MREKGKAKREKGMEGVEKGVETGMEGAEKGVERGMERATTRWSS